jgi:hypothetical protein
MAKRNSCTDCAHKRGYECNKARSSYWDGVKGVEVSYANSCNFHRGGIDFCHSHESKAPTMWERIKAVLL